MYKKVDILVLVAIFLALLGAAGLYLTRPAVRTLRISFPVDSICRGDGILYIPERLSRLETSSCRPPVIFLLPGIISLPDRYRGMAQELGRYGYASVAMNFPGADTRTNLKVLQAAARYIEESHPEVDSTRRAYFGHSLGGTTAVDAAYFDKNAYAGISIGYYIGGELAGNPKNVLLGTGIHDDLNDVHKMRSSIKSVTDGALEKEGARAGDFRDRTARELFISPFSNHASEKEDAYVVQRTVEWLDLSFFHRSQRTYPSMFHFRSLSAFVLFIGIFLILSYGGIALYKSNPGIFLFAWGCGFLACIVLLYCRSLSGVISVGGFGLFLVSGFASSFYGGRCAAGREGFRQCIIKLSTALCVFAATFSISQFIFSIGLFGMGAVYLYGFPLYMVSAFFITFLSYVESIVVYIAWYYPSLWMILFTIALLVATGDYQKSGLVFDLLDRAIKAIRGFFKYNAAKKIPAKEKILLVGLSALVVLAWLWVWRSGLLHMDVMLPYVLFIARYILVPLALWIWIFPATERR